MLCPNCGTENDASNVFCVECGARLKQSSLDDKTRARKYLGVETFRVLIFVFGLLILNWLLMNMSFLEDLQFRVTKVNTAMIIKSIIYLVIVAILLRYAVYLGKMWQKAFPKFFQAALFFQTIFYLIAISVFYDSTLWIFQQYVEDQQIILIYQLILAVLAVILLIRGFVYFYEILPLWLHKIDLSLPTPRFDEEEKEK